jgi:hypothetical protein
MLISSQLPTMPIEVVEAPADLFVNFCSDRCAKSQYSGACLMKPILCQAVEAWLSLNVRSMSSVSRLSEDHRCFHYFSAMATGFVSFAYDACMPVVWR